MAGKKGAVVQLQAEINSEEDWDKLLVRDGLIVVDVYSDWCGPCVGMVGNLKKCKLEMGGDSLHLAIAKSDDIEVLKRFRNKSEPTWMFIAGGQLLNVMFGANAPRLMQLIETELKNEQKVLKGEHKRKFYRFDELTPEEQTRAVAAAKLRAEEARVAAAKELAARNEERDHRYAQMLEALIAETLIVCLPHTVSTEDSDILTQLEPIWTQTGVAIAETVKVDITPEMWEEITYREGTEASEDLHACLALGPCLAILLRVHQFLPIGVSAPEVPGDVERMVWENVNMSRIQPGQPAVPNPESIPAKMFWTRQICEGPEEHLPPAAEPAPADEEQEKEPEETETAEKEEPQTLQRLCTAHATTVLGIFAPISPYSKCAGVFQLFPVRAQKIAVAESKILPPRIALVFEPDKADECFALAEELGEEVLFIGYFDKADPEEAVLLAKTQKQYARVPQNMDNKLVIVVAKRQSEPVLSFAALGPLYASPDETVGALDSDKFFPPGLELDPEADDSDASFESFVLSNEQNNSREEQRSRSSNKLSEQRVSQQSDPAKLSKKSDPAGEETRGSQLSNRQSFQSNRQKSQPKKSSNDKKLSATGDKKLSEVRASAKEEKISTPTANEKKLSDPRRSSVKSLTPSKKQIESKLSQEHDKKHSAESKTIRKPSAARRDEEEEEDDENGLTPITAVTAK